MSPTTQVDTERKGRRVIQPNSCRNVISCAPMGVLPCMQRLYMIGDDARSHTAFRERI